MFYMIKVLEDESTKFGSAEKNDLNNKVPTFDKQNKIIIFRKKIRSLSTFSIDEKKSESKFRI